MSPTVVTLICIAAVLTLFLLLITARWAWNRACNYAARHIEMHLARALEQPTSPRYRDIDAEYRALVIAQHNADD